MNELTPQLLRELLHYDPETGRFLWINSPGRRVKAGAVAGTHDSKGYVRIAIQGRIYKAHRLVWLHVHGAWPSLEMDHINGVRHDNRLSNLREVSSAENTQNRTSQANNKSGYRGVSWSKKECRWVAQIGHNYKRHFLGYYSTPEAAHEAYKAAAATMHTHNPFGVLP